MADKKFILVTGSNGLIGGALARELKKIGEKIITVDKGADIEIEDLFRWMQDGHRDLKFVFHLGANTNTLEMDKSVFKKYNYGYSESLWYKCARHEIPIIYASSAATYGSGELGYSDNTEPYKLKPLNPYGHSKNEFDKFVQQHDYRPPFWAALKFFNVYGYDESHKGKMASMAYHAYTQIKETGKVRLFKDGQQKRDFVYVDDVVSVMLWMMNNQTQSGIYNVGTGYARSFEDLAVSVFNAMNLPVNIEYFDIPAHIAPQYQSFTEADISKLKSVGYNNLFTSLENGIKQYIEKLENATSSLPAVAQ